MLPEWSSTIRALKDNGSVVHWDCCHCKAHGKLDLERVAAAKGWDFCLWDKLRVCERCDGIVVYSAARQPTNWPQQLLTHEGKQLLQMALDAVWSERNRK